MIALTTAIAACPVCAAGAGSGGGATSIWPLLLVAPFAVAAAAGLALWWMRRRAR